MKLSDKFLKIKNNIPSLFLMRIPNDQVFSVNENRSQDIICKDKWM